MVLKGHFAVTKGLGLASLNRSPGSVSNF